MASRLGRYFRRLFEIVGALAILGLVLVAVQYAYHPFDGAIARATAFVDGLDARLTQEAFKGITLGSLALIVALCVFPIFLHKIDERAYARGLWRGVISAAVFYLSNELYGMATKVGRIHFIVSMFAVIVVTILVVEGVSLSVREEEEKSFRTDIVASIASGLLFGVLVKLGGFGIEYLTTLLSKPGA
jgi:hypothetical protein